MTTPNNATPTDEAKLRELIARLDHYAETLERGMLAQTIYDAKCALAPHLAPGEPSDTELLGWWWRNRGHVFTTDAILKAGSGRATIKSAMRGEGAKS